MGRPIRITAQGSVIDDGSSGANWTVSGGTENAAANITGPDGTTISRVSFTQTSATNMFITCTVALSVAAPINGFEIDVHVAGCTDGTIQSYTGDFRVRDTGPTNTYVSDLALHPGWNRIRLGKGNFGVGAGTPNWQTTTFIDILMKINAIASQSLVVTVSNLRYAGYARPQIALKFDDGYTEVIDTAYGILSPFQFPATVGVISSKVGTAGYMTLANLNTLHSATAPWAMCNHTDTHGASPFLSSASQASCLTEIQTCQTYLSNQGFTRDNEHLMFVAPYGENSANYMAAAVQAGCKMFIGVGVGNNALPNSYPSSDNLETTLASQVYPGLNVVNTGWTGAQALAFVDRCIASGKSMIVNMHKIKGTPANDLDWSTAHFTTFVNGLYARSALLDVVTVPEFYSRLAAPTL